METFQLVRTLGESDIAGTLSDAAAPSDSTLRLWDPSTEQDKVCKQDGEQNRIALADA